MRSVFLAAACALFLGLCAYLGGNPAKEPFKLRLKLVDTTGKGVGGIVRVFPEGSNEPLQLPGLFDRLHGLTPSKDARGWYVVPAKGADVALPPARLRVEALSGLESARASQDIDLRDRALG